MNSNALQELASYSLSPDVSARLTIQMTPQGQILVGDIESPATSGTKFSLNYVKTQAKKQQLFQQSMERSSKISDTCEYSWIPLWKQQRKAQVNRQLWNLRECPDEGCNLPKYMIDYALEHDLRKMTDEQIQSAVTIHQATTQRPTTPPMTDEELLKEVEKFEKDEEMNKVYKRIRGVEYYSEMSPEKRRRMKRIDEKDNIRKYRRQIKDLQGCLDSSPLDEDDAETQQLAKGRISILEKKIKDILSASESEDEEEKK